MTYRKRSDQYYNFFEYQTNSFDQTEQEKA